MKISTGQAVEGRNFFGRKKELRRMAEILPNRRAGIFIPGPRRIGKTSLIKEFIRRRGEQYNSVYFDLEGRYSVVELCRDLTKQIQEAFPDVIKAKGKFKEKWNHLSKMISELEVAGVIKIKTGEIPQPLKQLITETEDIFHELYRRDFVFAFDEFSDFLLNLGRNGDGEAKFFLEWLRRLRQEEKIRLIITGSVNITSTLETLGLPYLLNDMTEVEILPLGRGEVKELLTKLLDSKHITLSSDILNFSADRLSDGIPFYVQLFADALAYHTGGKRHIGDLGEIGQIYDHITNRKHNEFNDLYTRLQNYLSGPQCSAARRILSNVCEGAMGFDDLYPLVEKFLPEKGEVIGLLNRLKDECYLLRESGRYGFVSPMLADWWRNHHGWEK